MWVSTEIHWKATICDPNVAIGRWCITASPNKSGNTIRDDSTNGDYIAVPEAVEGGIFRAANTGVQKDHVRIVPGTQEARIQIIDLSIVPGGRSYSVLHWQVCQTRKMGDSVHHAQGHYS